MRQHEQFLNRPAALLSQLPPVPGNKTADKASFISKIRQPTQEMPVETTIEKARKAMESGDIRRAKQILRSSFGNYGYSPRLFRAYAEILLALNEKTQAGRYLFFSVDDLEDTHQDAVSVFLANHSGEGYRTIVRSAPVHRFSRLSELPAYARQRLMDLGAPEDLSQVYSDDSDKWLLSGCLAAVVVVFLLVIIGLWTVIQWIFN